VLEEACGATRPGAARRLKNARYALYAIEKVLGNLPPSGALRDRLARARVYLLATSSLSARPLREAVAEAVEAGVDVVQLREKGLPGREMLALARALREITARRGAMFIVNDRPDIALLAHADGVHVGQEDLPLHEARAVVGSDLLVGVSTHSVEQARAAERAGADYIGAGPMFLTATKDAGPLLGPEGLRGVMAAVSLPVFAIGGIQPANLGDIAVAGGRRVAVSSAILSASDPGSAVRALRSALTSADASNSRTAPPGSSP
jgi:thiamine-phosphate pyrophosphorylase